MVKRDFKKYIIEVPDFPIPGVKFKDLSPLLTHELHRVTIEFENMVSHLSYDYVAGIDARGFIIGSALALQTGRKFLPIRKKGKLPGPKNTVKCGTEYSEIALEMNESSADPHYQEHLNRVLIVDDVLATGGSFKAAHTLCQLSGYRVTGFASIVNLTYLNKFEVDGLTCLSLIEY